MAQLELQLYDYNTWANQQLFDRLNELPSSLYRQKVDSVFPTIADVFAHVYLSDLGWIDVFSGKNMIDSLQEAAELKEETAAKEIKAMESSFIELANRYKSFLQQDGHLNKPLTLKNLLAASCKQVLPSSCPTSSTTALTIEEI